MSNLEFKYFQDVIRNGEFTEEKCQSCGTEENCLEGVYFDKGDEVSSVCLDCLKEGKITVEISDYVRDKLLTHVKQTFDQSRNEEITKRVQNSVQELEKNPPVPWIQYNDWTVCCGDYMQYVGEWKQSDFNDRANDGDGKAEVISILDEFTKSKIDSVDVFWNDIGRHTAVFVFRCLSCEKNTAVAQSY